MAPSGYGGGDGGGGPREYSRIDCTRSQPKLLQSRASPLYVNREPAPLADVATSMPQPGHTRIKSRPPHEPLQEVLIHWVGLLEDHSLPQ